MSAIKNPYTTDQKDHYVTARVAAEDYFFLKRLFPMTNGISDKVISILYKKFIDELRKFHADTPLEQAWYVESDTYIRVGELLKQFQRCAVGLPSGTERPRDESGTADGLHQTVLSSSVVSPDKKSHAKGRRRSKKETNQKHA